jgi:glycine C-acetyltransferase/8-amino-7-oxononanoate synthase
MKKQERLTFDGLNEVRFRGRKLVYFSGCDYFRLARNPKLAVAAVSSLHKNGLNVAASRITTGNRQIYVQLEAKLAKFFGADAAVILPDGYLAPIAVAQALAGEITHAFVDEFAHGALRDAARMLDCPLEEFQHLDVGRLKQLVSRCGPHAKPLILTDGMFSHDGSTAPLREYLKVVLSAGLVLVDDAHGAGVLGATGAGTLQFEEVGRRQIIQCATLSKAFGSYGGVVLASHALRQKIWSRSRAFIGTTPLPPPLAGAALMSLKILRTGKLKREKLFRKLSYTRTRLRATGWEIADNPGPIIRLPAMDEAAVATIKSRLLSAGIYPPYLKYPGASAQGVFRFVISSEHSRAHLDRLISVLAEFKSAGKFSGDKENTRTR